MIKFDILHFFTSDNLLPKLSGIEFIKNNKTNNNEEPKDSYITYVGESSLVISNSNKIKNKYKINSESKLYMITFMCANVNELYKKLKKAKIKTTTPAYGIRWNILLMPCKTKFKYMYVYPFKKDNIVFCFREINTSTDLLNYQKSMIPNSSERDILGVKEINLNLNITNEELNSLTSIFDNSYIDGNEFSSEIYTNETLTIKTKEEECSNITFEVRGKAFKGKEINLIENKKDVTFSY